jgi:hypothetical protein
MTYREDERLPPGLTTHDTAFLAKVQAWAETGAQSFREQRLPEYRTRLLASYHGCAGWPRARVALLWPLVTLASEAFERENLEAWRGALTALEGRVGGGSP